VIAMPARFELDDYITEADVAMVRRARRRSPAAADKIVKIIAGRVSSSQRRDQIVRKLMLIDGEDHAWPPPFLKERK
jgi:hypothetical protein